MVEKNNLIIGIAVTYFLLIAPATIGFNSISDFFSLFTLIYTIGSLGVAVGHIFLTFLIKKLLEQTGNTEENWKKALIISTIALISFLVFQYYRGIVYMTGTITYFGMYLLAMI